MISAAYTIIIDIATGQKKRAAFETEKIRNTRLAVAQGTKLSSDRVQTTSPDPAVASLNITIGAPNKKPTKRQSSVSGVREMTTADAVVKLLGASSGNSTSSKNSVLQSALSENGVGPIYIVSIFLYLYCGVDWVHFP